MAAGSKQSPKIGHDLITAYRICSPQWVETALSGEGSRRVGGRWNSPGNPAVYLGGSRALTALELLVHLPSPLSRASRFVLLEVSFPSELILAPQIATSIPNWNQEPPSKGTITAGDEWLKSRAHLGYRLPSIIIPQESIYLLNPLHAQFSQVRVRSQESFSFDPRLAQ